MGRLAPELPRPVWTLQAGLVANWFGNGAVGPFVLIYLHNVRGFPLGTAGLALAASSGTALIAGPVLGSLVDRLGARSVLAGSLLLTAAGYGAFPLVRSPWHAILLLGLAGVGSAGWGTSQSSLVAALTPPRRRLAAFAQQRVSIHLGLGLGAVTGGLIASAARPESFTPLFLLGALACAANAAVLLVVPSPRSPACAEPGRYREVLVNRPFLGFLAVNALVVAGGIVPMASFLPVFAKNEAGVSEAQIGLLLLLGSLLIVLAQLPIARVLAGRRRMPTLALMAAAWAFALLAVAAGGLWQAGEGALAVFAGAATLFGVGQCLHGSIQNPLTADLAQPRSMGRYMALLNFSWQIGLAAGPAAGGFVLEAEPLALWPLGAVVCLIAGGLALALERSLPAPLRRTPKRADGLTLAGAQAPS